MTQPLFPDTVQSILNDMETQVHDLETHAILSVADQAGTQQINASVLQVFNYRALGGFLAGGSALNTAVVAGVWTDIWAIGSFTIQSPIVSPTAALLLALGFINVSSAPGTSPSETFLKVVLRDSLNVVKPFASAIYNRRNVGATSFRPYFVANLQASDDSGAVTIPFQGTQAKIGTFKVVLQAMIPIGGGGPNVTVSPAPSAGTNTDSHFDVYTMGTS